MCFPLFPRAFFRRRSLRFIVFRKMICALRGFQNENNFKIQSQVTQVACSPVTNKKLYQSGAQTINIEMFTENCWFSPYNHVG